jgi:ABC-type transporter MlaC component
MKFRQWINEKWYEHKKECIYWKTPSCEDAQTYFRKYRWFLKRKYKQEVLDKAK